MEPIIPKVVQDGGEKGKFIFEAWGSVEVLDKDGQILPITEIMKSMPTMVKRGGVVHLGHTNRVVGRIQDFWKSDWVDPDDKNRKIPGIMFKAELFGDYKSDLEARKGVREGKYRMVSFGGMSWKGEHLEGSKGSAELMKDLEGWEFALVEKGKNPLAYLTNINGISIAKGEIDSPFEELVKDQRFNNILQSFLMDGVRYSEAIEKAKTSYFSTGHDNEIRKGEMMGDNDSADAPTNEVLSLEDLQKGYVDLYKAVEEMKELVGEMAEGYLELTKEIVKPEDPDVSGHPNPPPTISKGEMSEDDEELEEPEEAGKRFAKGFIEELTANGFTSAGTPVPKSDEVRGVKMTKGSSGVVDPAMMPEEFEKAYMDMMGRRLNKGLEDKEKFSFSKEGAKLMNYTPEGEQK